MHIYFFIHFGLYSSYVHNDENDMFGIYCVVKKSLYNILGYHYHVNVLLSGSDESRTQKNESGLLFVRITGSKGKTSLLQATPQ